MSERQPLSKLQDKSKTILSVVLPIIILALAILGARLDSPAVLYAMLAVVGVAVALSAFNCVREKSYPYLTFAIGLALLWQTSLIGNSLVGTDIHTEFYFCYAALNGWDYTMPHAYNSAIGSTLLAPLLTRLLHVDSYWVYKAIFPLLFAFVPLLLYFVFKKEFGAKTAFLSAFFFVSIPTYTLELVGLPRQQLGELMFAVVLFTILVVKWPTWIRVGIIFIATVLGLLFHYVTGPFILLYIGMGAIILLFFRRRTFPVKYLLLIALVAGVGAIAYYTMTTQGVTLYNISGGLDALISRTFHINLHLVEYTNTSAVQVPINATIGNETMLIPPYVLPPNFGREPLLNTALGLDFLSASAIGKAFRVFQYVTQGLIVVGAIALWRKRKEYSAEYLALVAVSIILLGLCVVVPRFSNFLNLTRYYHFALFTLAPLIVLGGRWILRSRRALVLVVLIPYFAFTSGAVCEIAHVSDISSINIPYSYALSHERLDIGAVASDNDLLVRDYIVENELYPIYSDVNGMLFLSEQVDWRRWNYSFFYVRRDPENVLNEGYMYFREANTQRQGFTLKPIVANTTSGMREFVPFEDVQLGIYRMEIVFEVDDAKVVHFWKGSDD